MKYTLPVEVRVWMRTELQYIDTNTILWGTFRIFLMTLRTSSIFIQLLQYGSTLGAGFTIATAAKQMRMTINTKARKK